MHTAGIFSDMTVDGPETGTLVVVIDRAKNLPNRRKMGKQDPYCAARLGKEAKKTETDKRGGQTPKWDQEMRFTVHDSPDYHNLKVSVFNDDKKTELIGETWVNLDGVLVPGGGQSDTWHNLNCKGKYAGEIRIELTYYDTRPKVEKALAEKRRESARPSGADGQSPSVSGPRESTPVKRRPLPSNPTSASPSPAAAPEHRGISAPQSGHRSYHTPPRQQSTPNRPNEYTPTHQRRSHYHEQQSQSVERRRPVPEASPLNPKASSSTHNTPQHQTRARSNYYDAYSPANNYQSPNGDPERDENAQEEGPDPSMEYPAPKPYTVQPIELPSQNPREPSNRTSMFPQSDFQSNTDAPYVAQSRSSYMDLPHSQSAPIVPSYQTLVEPGVDGRNRYQNRSEDFNHGHAPQQLEDYRQTTEPYRDLSPAHHVEPLRAIQYYDQSHDSGHNQLPPQSNYYQEPNGYPEPHHPYDPYESHGRPTSAMQPTVEDEDDIPPPPPAHRSSAPTVAQYESQHPPPNYQQDIPAPLNLSRYREDPCRAMYESPSQSYKDVNDYNPPSLSTKCRNTHPLPSMSPIIPQPQSRPESRDAMIPSPLRHESYPMPTSLVAGYNSSNPDEHSRRLQQDNRISVRGDPRNSPSYQPAPSYETPPHQRHLSQSEYQTPPTYETPPRPRPLSHRESVQPADSPSHYPHSSPQEPQQMPYQDPAPIIKPRAVSPADVHNPIDNRMSRGPARSTPTRKSVSPRPPPSDTDSGERRLSGTPFSPDSFDALNPAVRNSNLSGNGSNYASSIHSMNSPHSTHGFEHSDERRSSNVELNEKGQVVTFNGRVIDASDHLPVDSWAPEPERKTPQKERPARERPELNGARDLEAAMKRERERKERDRIRNAVNGMGAGTAASPVPSTALTLRRHDVSPAAAAAMGTEHESPTAASRNRLQKRDRRPVAAAAVPLHSPGPSHIPSPNSNVLRERENLGKYGGSPGYGVPRTRMLTAPPPPVPAKIPVEAGDGLAAEDLTALSLELRSIDIGSGGGGRRAVGRRRGY